MRDCQDGFHLWGFESELLSFDLAFATSSASWAGVNTTFNMSWAVEASVTALLGREAGLPLPRGQWSWHRGQQGELAAALVQWVSVPRPTSQLRMPFPSVGHPPSPSSRQQTHFQHWAAGRAPLHIWWKGQGENVLVMLVGFGRV